jgi:hypothetical protein
MNSRHCLFLLSAVLLCLKASAQPEEGTSNIQAGGGYTSVIIESTAESAHGFIINGMYEIWLVPNVGIGGSVHYLHVSDQGDSGGSGTASSLPLYLNGKYYFGKEKFRFFVSGSVGFQFSWRDLEDSSGNTGSDHDSGLTAGAGAGLVYAVNSRMLLNLNYTLYGMRNAYYSNGLANTVSLNLGFILGR